MSCGRWPHPCHLEGVRLLANPSGDLFVTEPAAPDRLERLLFLAAIGVIALHVADDSFSVAIAAPGRAPHADRDRRRVRVRADRATGGDVVWLELEGWYVPSKNRAAVIAFGGRKGTQRPTRMLVRHGYGVLLFDRRGEGDSDGDPNALGWDLGPRGVFG